jgi:hypothetical protein
MILAKVRDPRLVTIRRGVRRSAPARWPDWQPADSSGQDLVPPTRPSFTCIASGHDPMHAGQMRSDRPVSHWRTSKPLLEQDIDGSLRLQKPADGSKAVAKDKHLRPYPARLVP